MVRKKIISITMSALLSINSLWNPSMVFYEGIVADAKTEPQNGENEVVSDAGAVSSGGYGLADKTQDGVILHAFCWSFKTIKENMKDIAEAGYTTVQTSPANACNDSHPQMKLYDPSKGTDYDGSNGCWWWHYQPTDWTIGNYQLGTKEDYAAMCEEADKYGVKIITDVIPNHTTPDLQRVSQSLVNAAGGKLYHDNGFKGIQDNGDWSWGNRLACTTGMMGGLPDVNTENQGFQAYYLKYCNDLIDIGCDGFRYDTAKHIGVPSDPTDSSNTRGVNDFWDVATGKKEVNGVKLKNADDVFIYGEVLQGNNVPTSEYAKYMFQTASDYGGVIRDAIGSNDFSVGNISNWKHSNPDRIVSWVESHDTYCNNHPSAWMSDWQIRACWAVITARKQGVPLFMSRPDGSNGSSGNYWGNNVLGAKGNDQFKHPEVVACNKFRNAMIGQEEYMSNPNGSGNLLVIERGNKGAVVVNLGSSTSNIKLQKVADGTYTEQVSGKQVEVSGGVLKCDVAGGSIAVICNLEPVTKNPSVSVSKDSGDFTEPFELKLTPSNATKATYSINGGDAVEFTKATTVKIGEDAEVGDKITVKVTAEGDGDPFSETYTYTMAEEPEIPVYKLYVRTKKSDYSSKPMAYVYTGEGASAKKLNGEWPGAGMKEEGEYYVFATNDVDSARIIFSYDNGQDPASEQPGYEVSGYMEYDKSSKKVTSFTPSTPKPKVTKEPVKVTEPPAKETEPPVKETEPPKTKEPVKETEVPTTTTTPAKATSKPTEQPSMVVSKEDGTSFSTETMDVKITLASGTKGTYSVDNGPEKSFTSSVTVEVGKGKIADSDVTLKVKAGGKTETYTYKKDFDPAKATVKASAVSMIKSVFEIVSDAADVNAAAESDAYYATNPNGFGKEATITIDGSFSDWSEDMLIAQGGAWDIANNFKGGHENCVLDDYALYAAWDNDNLYIGWQMVNTTDTWAKSGDGPLSDGGRVLDVPLLLALNVGNRPAMTGKMANGKLIWDALDINFETRVDNILLMSGKVGLGTPGFFIASDASGGASYDPEYCLSFKTEGISYKMAEGCLPKSIMMLKGATDVSDVHDKSKYVDAMSEGHNTTYDSFYEINIPLKTLGIDKSYIEENGIGVMQIATRGTSGIDCIPHDPSMLDNATGECAVDPSTSHEKDDSDIITVPLAAVGNAKAGGDGKDVVPATKAPTKTEEPVKETAVPEKETKAPTKTEPAKKTEEPTKTEEVKETKQPEKTAAAKPTEAPTATPKVTPKPTSKPVSGPDYDGDFTVNFGADRSSPQYQTTALTLKAIPYGGSGDYTYEFKVDGTTIQEESETDYCEWNGTAGSHTIKVIVRDGDGAQITCQKSYDLETKSGTATEEPESTGTPEISATPVVDNGGKKETPSENVSDKLSMSVNVNKKSPQEAGTTLTLSISAKGGTAPYKYTITVEDGINTPNILLSKSNSNGCLWTPVKAGTYKLQYTVEDSKGEKVVQTEIFKVSSCVSVSKFTADKYTVRKGKKVKFTMAATSMVSSAKKIQYQISAVKSGKSAKTLLRKYANAKSYTWKTKKKGKYTIYLTAKDFKGNTKTVKLKKKITVK